MKGLSVVTMLFALCVVTPAFSAVYYSDNFDYGATSGNLTTQSGGVWIAHSSAGTNPVGYNGSASLSVTGYGYSGVGGSATIIGGSAEDVHANLTSALSSAGSYYVSFLVNLSSATTGGDYFLHFRSSSSFRGRVYARDDGAGNLNFGLAKSTTIVWATGSYTYGTTYLIVIKYTIVTDTTGSDDTVDMFVLTAGQASEPVTPPDASEGTGTDQTLDVISIRQGTNGPTGVIDGLRVSDTWAEAMPVQLLSFYGNVFKNRVELVWDTAAEIDILGFNLYRSALKGHKLLQINPQIIIGQGDATSGASYSFSDTMIDSVRGYRYYLEAVESNGESRSLDVTDVFFKVKQ